MAKTSKAFQKFHSKISGYSDKKILITLRGAPDPDSISSALAHKMLLKHFGVDSTILHTEEVSHQENRALVKLLQIDLVLYREGFKLSDYSAISLVDSSQPDIRILEELSDIPILSIVDHHDFELSKKIKAEYVDIRQEVGATATIYAQYLKEINFLKKGMEDHENLATALVHGIRTDTSGLTMAKEEDFYALAYLSNFSNTALLEKISRQQITPATMDIIFAAFKNKETVEDFIISGVGMIRPEERDALPQAADFLLRRVGIHTVIVFGIVDGYIDCSLRTNSDMLKPDAFIEEVFSDVKYGECGGKVNQGGFRIPLGIFKSVDEPQDKKLLIQLVELYIKRRFYAKLGIDKS